MLKTTISSLGLAAILCGAGPPVHAGPEGLAGINPVPEIPAQPTLLAQAAAANPSSSAPVSAFDAGLADRQAWENWFAAAAERTSMTQKPSGEMAEQNEPVATAMASLDAAEAKFLGCVDRRRSPSWNEFDRSRVPPGWHGDPEWEVWAKRFNALSEQLVDTCQDAGADFCKLMEASSCRVTLVATVQGLISGSTHCYEGRCVHE